METTSGATRPETRAIGRWFGLAGIMLTTIGAGLVLTVVIVALPTLAVKLNATTGDMQWIVGAFQLTIAALMLPAGFLGDRYGRKKFLAGAAGLFGLASLAATQVTTVTQLIWIMAVIGAAGAVIIPLALSIMPTLFPDESQRKLGIGLWAAGQFLTLPLGPLVGGWLLNHYDWTSIFWVNAPFAFLGLLGIAFFIPENRDESARRLDVGGTLLSVGGMFSLVYGIIRGPVDGWGSPDVLVGLVGGIVLLLTFLAWEWRSKTPLLELGLFAHPSFTWSAIALALAFAVLTGGLFMVSPYLQVVQGTDVMGTGIRLLPMVVTMMLAAGAADKLTRRLGSRAVIAGGLVVMAGGTLLLSRATVTSGYELIGAALAVTGVGVGLVLAPAFDALVVSLPGEQKGIGSAVGNAMGKLAQAMGVAVLGAILNSVYRSQLPALPRGLPPAAVTAIQGNVAAAVKVAARLGPQGHSLAAGARAAYVSGMSEVLVICTAIAVVSAVVIAVFLPSTQKVEAAGSRGEAPAAPTAPGQAAA